MNTPATPANVAIVALARSIAADFADLAALAVEVEEAKEAAEVGNLNLTIGTLLPVQQRIDFLKAQLDAVTALHGARRKL
jgi:hypothetical protein